MNALVNQCPKLYKIKLEKNKIESLDKLKCLAGHKITKINLEGNPLVESNKEYRKELFELIPSLVSIDGIDKKRIAKKSMLFMLPITLFLAGAYILNFITYRDYEEKGQNLIDKVECYKKTHNRLPQNVGEMGMTETEGVGPYYFKDDSIHYRIIFSLGFDTSYTYSSDTQKWENAFTFIHQF